MAFLATSIDTDQSAIVQPYHAILEDGSIEYGLIDREGGEWIIAVLQPSGTIDVKAAVPEIDSAYVEDRIGIRELDVLIDGETAVNPAAPVDTPASPVFTLEDGSEIALQYHANEPELFLDGKLLGWFIKKGEELCFRKPDYSTPVPFSKLFDDSASASSSPVPIGCDGAQIELRQDGYSPDIIIDGKAIGWLSLDGETLKIHEYSTPYTLVIAS